MTNDFKSLLSEVCAIVMDYKRLNDVAIGPETYSLIFKDVQDSAGKSETRLFLRSSKMDDYGLTVRQLAGLRIADGAIKATWFDEFRDDANGTTLQARLKEDAKLDLSSIKFKVVAQLKVKNEFASGLTPVYNDRCYEGSIEYRTGVRALVANKPANFWATTEYSFGMRDLREKLHATRVKEGKAIEANEVRLPIFEII
jgi:hypothetical protein